MKTSGFTICDLRFTKGSVARESEGWSCLKVPAARANNVAARHCPPLSVKASQSASRTGTANSDDFQSIPITFKEIMKSRKQNEAVNLKRGLVAFGSRGPRFEPPDPAMRDCYEYWVGPERPVPSSGAALDDGDAAASIPFELRRFPMNSNQFQSLF
jgi:hypothetical protein